jgi:hypothetical protein
MIFFSSHLVSTLLKQLSHYLECFVNVAMLNGECVDDQFPNKTMIGLSCETVHVRYVVEIVSTG